MGDCEAGQDHRERHVDLLPRVEEELRLRHQDPAARDQDQPPGPARELLARRPLDAEPREPAAARERKREPAEVLEDQPREAPRRLGDVRDAAAPSRADRELAIELRHRRRVLGRAAWSARW